MRANRKLGVVDSDIEQRSDELLAKLKTVKSEEEITAKGLELALQNEGDALLISQLQNSLKKLRKTKMDLFSRINELRIPGGR